MEGAVLDRCGRYFTEFGPQMEMVQHPSIVPDVVCPPFGSSFLPLQFKP